jgi:integration host factor subunit beta
MTRAELVEEVARASKLTRKQSEVVVEAVFMAVGSALQSGEKVEVRGFGSFRVRRRQSRPGRNPRTGEGVIVPARSVPYFKPGKDLRRLINRDALSPHD